MLSGLITFTMGDYQDLQCKISEKRLKLAGHCVRHPEEPLEPFAWSSQRNRGRQQTTFVDVCERYNREFKRANTRGKDLSHWFGREFGHQ
jgi:hypothetical protein